MIFFQFPSPDAQVLFKQAAKMPTPQRQRDLAASGRSIDRDCSMDQGKSGAERTMLKRPGIGRIQSDME
jgi:hypothetical protein